MRGEIIAIGDELTTGQRLDTNTQWLAERLTDAGVDVLYHSTVGDDLQANIMVFASAIERADVVVATGGLGPTADDLTRESLAAAAGVALELDEASLAHIRGLFAARGRDMPERNTLQAMFPAGAKPIPNEHGTAPGFELSVAREARAPCVVHALPGVPAEMKPMWRETVLPAIQKLQPSPRTIRHRRLKCFGVGESHLEQMMPELIARRREPLVGITVHKATITLRITASGPDEAACLAAMAPTEEEIRQTLGVLVFGEEDDELQHVVLRQLAAAGKTLAVADAASGGLLVHWLAEADPRHRGFVGGEVRPLVGADEPSTARAAEELRGQRGVDFALVLAPAAEGSETVVVALAYEGGARVRTFPNAVHPDLNADRAAKLALNELRRRLMGNEGE